MSNRDTSTPRRKKLHTAGRDALEIDAGPVVGLQTQMLLNSHVKRNANVNIDPRVIDNPHLHKALVADAISLPFEDNSFDLVFRTMVAEHLSDRTASVQESLRVPKSGGLLMFHTVSFWSYASLIAAATPHWFHLFFVRHLGMGRIEENVFPVHYRNNTAFAIGRITRKLGVNAGIEKVPGPRAYLAFSYPT